MESDCWAAIAMPDGTSKVLFQPLVNSPPLSTCEMCVIVPVRNEAETLATTLSALANQADLAGRPLDPNRYEVILFANNCSDDSASSARQFASQHSRLVLHVIEKTLPAAEAYIGRVRQLLMDEAYRRLMSIGAGSGVIASTDGDSQVAPTWVAATLHEIASGADAVGGRIITDRAGRAALAPYARACHLREVGYRSLIAELEAYLDPDPCDQLPRHYQHYGASLAVTAAMYAQAGGMPPVRTPEDVAFYRALKRVDARFRHSPLVRVTTSARQAGRTDIGLANQLDQWTRMGQQPFWVESAQAVTARLRGRRWLRLLWQHYRASNSPIVIELAPVANLLGINPRWLSDELVHCQRFGLLLDRLEQQQSEEGIWQRRWQLVKIEQAIADLRLLLHRLRYGVIAQSVSSRLQPSLLTDIRLMRDSLKVARTDPADTVPVADLLDAVV
jgi:hypothetical protein